RSIRKTYICTTGVKGRGSATRAKSMKRALVLALALWSGLAILQPAHGQTAASDYPQRAVTFLCPFPAGGGTDILTRMRGRERQEKLARAVIVDNRPGAGTIVAAQAAARAAPDGHTILVAPATTLAMAPSVHKSLPDRRKGAARALPRQRGCAHRR